MNISPEGYMSLTGEFRALSSTFLKRSALGTRWLPSIIDDVAQDCWAELASLTPIDESITNRDRRTEEQSALVYKAASHAVNRYVTQLRTRGRGDGEIIPFKPTSPERDEEDASFYFMSFESLAEQAVEDEHFAEDETALTVDFGAEDLNVVAQGLADGLPYTTIASRLGYTGKAPRQFVYNRVRILRRMMTDV